MFGRGRGEGGGRRPLQSAGARGNGLVKAAHGLGVLLEEVVRAAERGVHGSEEGRNLGDGEAGEAEAVGDLVAALQVAAELYEIIVGAGEGGGRVAYGVAGGRRERRARRKQRAVGGHEEAGVERGW